MQKDWVVYSKPCIAYIDTVVDYLARYSHRIALSDSRLLDGTEGQVQLRYKDYRDHDRHKVMSLSGEELIRRFLLHILPKGLMRIRYYGFLANRCRKAKLAQIRQAIGQAEEQAKETEPAEGEPYDPYRCPHCGEGRLQRVVMLAPQGRLRRAHAPPRPLERTH